MKKTRAQYLTPKMRCSIPQNILTVLLRGEDLLGDARQSLVLKHISISEFFPHESMTCPTPSHSITIPSTQKHSLMEEGSSFTFIEADNLGLVQNSELDSFALIA